MAVAGDIFRAAVHYTILNSSDVLNVFWWIYGGPGDTDAQVLDQIDDFLTNVWGADWDANSATDAMIDFADVDVINLDGTVNRNVGTALIGVPGSTGVDSEPGPVSQLITAETVLPKVRGRKFVPGIDDTLIVDGLLTAAALTNLVLMVLDYILVLSSLLSGNLTPGVLRKTAMLWEDFSGTGIVSDIPACQRRRKPNVGS